MRTQLRAADCYSEHFLKIICQKPGAARFAAVVMVASARIKAAPVDNRACFIVGLHERYEILEIDSITAAFKGKLLTT